MHRVLGFFALFLLLLGAVLFVGACGTGSTTTTGPPASTGTSAAPMIPASTTTVAGSAATPTSTAQGGEVGTKGNPVPRGTGATVGNWKIKVTSTNLNADAAVKNAPGYQPPDPGTQYMVVNLQATYTGEQPDSFGNGVGARIVGSKGDTFDPADIGLDKSIDNSDAVGKGGSVSGPLVFEVSSTEIDGATLWMAPSSALEETGTYFALK
jgi:hypothetical protein